MAVVRGRLTQTFLRVCNWKMSAQQTTANVTTSGKNHEVSKSRSA